MRLFKEHIALALAGHTCKAEDVKAVYNETKPLWQKKQVVQWQVQSVAEKETFLEYLTKQHWGLQTWQVAGQSKSRCCWRNMC